MGKLGEDFKADFTQKRKIQTNKESTYYETAKSLLTRLDEMKWGCSLDRIESVKKKLYDIPSQYIEQVIKDCPELEEAYHRDEYELLDSE